MYVFVSAKLAVRTCYNIDIEAHKPELINCNCSFQLGLIVSELRHLTKLPNEIEVRQIFEKFDTDNDGCISFEEFEQAINQQMKRKRSLASLFTRPADNPKPHRLRQLTFCSMHLHGRGWSLFFLATLLLSTLKTLSFILMCRESTVLLIDEQKCSLHPNNG